MSLDPFVVVVAVAMVIGIVGTVVPFVPGLWLIWAAALVYGIGDGFDSVGVGAFVVITLLAIAGTAAAALIPQRSASGVGVPWQGQLLAAALAAVGFFVVPIVGAAVGFALGIFLVVANRTGDLGAAVPATWSVIRSMLIASGLQLVTATLMFVTWLVWVVA